MGFVFTNEELTDVRDMIIENRVSQVCLYGHVTSDGGNGKLASLSESSDETPLLPIPFAEILNYIL